MAASSIQIGTTRPAPDMPEKGQNSKGGPTRCRNVNLVEQRWPDTCGVVAGGGAVKVAQQCCSRATPVVADDLVEPPNSETKACNVQLLNSRTLYTAVFVSPGHFRIWTANPPMTAPRSIPRLSFAHSQRIRNSRHSYN